ncbi:MAG: ECF-type sigma factor [Thermonemataceae bacterium]
MERTPEEITRLLEDARKGNKNAYDRVFPLIYQEIRQVAHYQRFQWKGEHTMNTTALVHEVYIKLADGKLQAQNKKHFLAIIGRAIRQILINYAKKQQAAKRGGNNFAVDIDDFPEILIEDPKLAEELVTLNHALEKLERKDHKLGKIVECRFFAGMTLEETADVLDLSVATIKRHWNLAKAWLHREVKLES